MGIPRISGNAVCHVLERREATDTTGGMKKMATDWL